MQIEHANVGLVPEAVVQSKPLSVADTKNLLGPDEALVVYFTTSNQSYVWAITHGCARDD